MPGLESQLNGSRKNGDAFKPVFTFRSSRFSFIYIFLPLPFGDSGFQAASAEQKFH